VLSSINPQLAVELLAKITVVLVAVTLVSFLFRRWSAARRHALGVAALTSTLMLPLLVAWLPGWHIGTAASTSHERPVLAPEEPLLPGFARHLSPSVSAPASEDPWRWVTSAWMIGFAAVGVWIACGIGGARRLRLQGRPVDDERVTHAFERARRRAGNSRPVRLLRHERMQVPVAVGLRHPVILLPGRAAEWPAQRLERVLVHELAHVRRQDNLTHLIARITCAIYWFHPLVWLVARQLKLEREQAADDIVVASGSPSSTYAEDLLTLARAQPRPHLIAAVTPASGGSVARRIAALVDPRRDRQPATRRSLAATAAMAAAVVLPIACATSTEPSRAVDTPGSFADTEPLATFEADGAVIDLLGVDAPDAVDRGDAFAMTLYWRLREPLPESRGPEERWRVFVHIDGQLPNLYDPAHPGARINADHAVNAPGTWWDSSEVFADRFAVMAGHADYPAGDYAIFVGWFKGLHEGEWTNAAITGGRPPRDPLEHNRFRVADITLR
jgi:beta-lactamase regulating signal transducer with metallopeptidase domain